MSNGDIADHGRRIAELERKVSELYKRLGQAEPQQFGMTFPSEEGTGVANPIDDPRIVELVQAGKKIEAIKLLRELTGVGLAEAKDAIDGLDRMY